MHFQLEKQLLQGNICSELMYILTSWSLYYGLWRFSSNWIISLGENQIFWLLSTMLPVMTSTERVHLLQ